MAADRCPKAEDVLATARAVAALGASVEMQNGICEIRGRGVGGLSAPRGPLDFGNSDRICVQWSHPHFKARRQWFTVEELELEGQDGEIILPPLRQ